MFVRRSASNNTSIGESSCTVNFRIFIIHLPKNTFSFILHSFFKIASLTPVRLKTNQKSTLLFIVLMNKKFQVLCYHPAKHHVQRGLFVSNNYLINFTISPSKAKLKKHPFRRLKILYEYVQTCFYYISQDKLPR